ncbi:speckle-type POZ protein [Culex quinquefasciatus]|uniref:speckle-type POZ protein n=1 Tax=Culex quinquefasciatus TaxID=7176 RepID=UPI0018E328A0|nr:speckle-type POZ protein [Culex quinquefasciatus]
MFEHDMQESKENTVKITDIRAEVFQEVLRFIYTGKVQDMDQLARALLIAADKYSLDTLKSKCSEHLGSRLSVATATATLELADKYNAGALKQQAIKFISKHVKQLNPADWKEVLTNNFDVAAEIIAQMVKEK